MRIGIMSDSHGDAAATRRAVELLTQQGARKLFHCGDICGTGVLDELAGHDCVFVWGNCDTDTAALRPYVAALGLPWPQSPAVVELAGRRIGVCHGHERHFHTAAAGLDYLLYGHTHRYADHRTDGCRMINPGALDRAKTRTVAVLDLAKDDLRFLRLDTGEPVPVERG